jgi:hypothetical protein
MIVLRGNDKYYYTKYLPMHVRSRKRLIPKEIDNDNDDDTLNEIQKKKKNRQ